MIASRSAPEKFVSAARSSDDVEASTGTIAPRDLLSLVAAACARLKAHGWGMLLGQHGLDLDAVDLRAELLRSLSAIDRTAPGFEDFALEGHRGIEPGDPARSLLFHAFASAQIVRCRDGSPLLTYPTPAEIEAVENFVYGAEPPSIDDLRARAADRHLAVIVVSAEYRPAIGTVHRKHADMCYARTGVTRVGTASAHYLPAARGYLPFAPEQPHAVRVLPCRYAAYIAALAPGDKSGHGPMRYIDAEEKVATAASARRKDAGVTEAPSALRRNVPDGMRHFWVPVHKLFDGPECLRGKHLTVRLSANHVNEKLRRAHLRFLAGGHHGGWAEPDISDPPFIFRDGIAEFSPDPADGSWLLMPVVHPKLVEAAMYKGKPLTYVMPATDSEGLRLWEIYRSSLNFVLLPSGARAAPEYLHARHVIDENGKEYDLNAAPNLVANLKRGRYCARHYLDFTGDGWIDVECAALALDIPRRLPAYSIVASPDFFPKVNQTDLMQWTDQSVHPSMLSLLWSSPGAGRPQALSDQRYAANVSLDGAGFDPADDTMTAIVGRFGSGNGQLTRLAPLDPDNRRASILPDSAAGVFAPGWDVSYDRTAETDASDSGESILPGVTFLTNYGLGSPFVEDAMLCAALSSFWPAVAPDVSRTFEPLRTYATATPLTDEAIGLGKLEPWDGIRGPQLGPEEKTVEYTALIYGDYVRSALDEKFRIGNIGLASAPDYFARTLTMALVYQALGVTNHEGKLVWSVLSFAPVDASHGELREALEETGRNLSREYLYRYEMYRHARDGARQHPTNFTKVVIDVLERVVLFADPSTVLKKTDRGWQVYELRR